MTFGDAEELLNIEYCTYVPVCRCSFTMSSHFLISTHSMQSGSSFTHAERDSEVNYSSELIVHSVGSAKYE